MINLQTLQQLYTGIKSDLETQFSDTISTLGKSFLRGFAKVQAGKLKLYYLLIGSIQKNIFVDTADSEASGGTLERFGRVKLGRNPFAAVAGQYQLSVTGSIGATLPASTVFKSDDSSLNPGFLFILDNAYTLTATTDMITVRALTSGLVSQLNLLDTLTATAPIALVNSSVYVQTSVVAPLAAESVEEYRHAIIQSYQLAPQGGAATDFRLWAQDAQGVRFTYPYAKSGSPAEVNVFVEANVADSIDAKGTPSSTLLTTVASVIETNPNTAIPTMLRGRRPLGVWAVYCLPVTARTVDITITGYTGITLPVKALLLTAITNAVNLIRPYVSGADLPSSKNDILDINKLIGVIISAQPGAVFASVSFKVGGTSYPTFPFTQGDIPYLNPVITYV